MRKYNLDWTDVGLNEMYMCGMSHIVIKFYSEPINTLGDTTSNKALILQPYNKKPERE
jgi:hypothetical protein